jgi:ribulose-phosphate 3-epimerase
MPTMKIAPSILSADFSRLKDEIQAVEAAEPIDLCRSTWTVTSAQYHHRPVVVSGCAVTTIAVDVHLMITDPVKYARNLSAGADWVSIHPDTCANPNATLRKIRQLGAKHRSRSIQMCR